MLPGRYFPYLGGPHEGKDEAEAAYRAFQDSKKGSAPFVSPGTDKLASKPTKAVAWEMMNDVRRWILKDWKDADVALFENHQVVTGLTVVDGLACELGACAQFSAGHDTVCLVSFPCRTAGSCALGSRPSTHWTACLRT